VFETAFVLIGFMSTVFYLHVAYLLTYLHNYLIFNFHVYTCQWCRRVVGAWCRWRL